MSFSSQVKEELCRSSMSRACCTLAEAYGVLLFCNAFSTREIRIVTESRQFAQRLVYLFKSAFSLEFDSQPEDMHRPGKLSYRMTDPKKLEKIFSAYGYDAANCIAVHINLALLEEECCKASFLRGAFLAGGSVTDPEKSYHLEMVTPHFNVRGETLSVLLELGLSPKDASRNGSYIIYFKQSEFIEDFLTRIGASGMAMELMATKVEKELINGVNRKVNCETANLTKTVDAAQVQIHAINRIRQTELWDTLPDKLRQTALMRLENPEANLSELAEMFDPPVTKSCLNHRLRKIIEISKGK